MIRSVVREHHWQPSVIGRLFLDNEDSEGLEYWYEDILLMHDQLKNKNTGDAKNR